jgi:hypothetical protein
MPNLPVTASTGSTPSNAFIGYNRPSDENQKLRAVQVHTTLLPSSHHSLHHVLPSIHSRLTFLSSLLFLLSCQAKADEVTKLARENIQLSVAQVDRLQDLELRAEALEADSRSFHQGATRVRRLMCIRSWKMLGLILVLLAVLVTIIVVSVVETARK